MRRTPLRRKTRLKPKRSAKRRVDPSRVRSEKHKAKVRGLPCICYLWMADHRCNTKERQASHDDNGKGAGMKTSDLTCVSMCALAHDDWTNHRGVFKGWTREYRRWWFKRATEYTLALLKGSRSSTLGELNF